MEKLTRCPLPDTVLRPGESRTICSDPVSPFGRFYPSGIVVDAGCAAHFLVDDVKVGRNSQLVALGALPAELFSSERDVVPLFMDRCLPGDRVLLSLTCRAPEPVVFRSWVVGGARRPRGVLYYACGLGCREVGPGQTGQVVVVPHVDFEPRRLFVPRRLLDAFRIDGVVSGKFLDVQYPSSVAPLSLFPEALRAGGEVELFPVKYVSRAMPISVAATNTSPETASFAGAVLGTSPPARKGSRR